MKLIKEYFRKSWSKRAPKSTLVALDSSSSVLVLHESPEELAVVKKYFTTAVGVRVVKKKRPKDSNLNGNMLHLNDFDFYGVPKAVLPELTQNKHFVINLCKEDALSWYWYTRKYALRVDLQGIYENADFTVAGQHTMDEKLATLVKYLKMINHE